MVKEKSLGAKVDYFKFWIQLSTRRRQKMLCHRHLRPHKLCNSCWKLAYLVLPAEQRWQEEWRNDESWNHLYGDVTLLKDLTNRSCSLLAVESSYKRPRNQTFCSCLCQRCNITNSSSSDEWTQYFLTNNFQLAFGKEQKSRKTK